jgi:hypothetical protein
MIELNEIRAKKLILSKFLLILATLKQDLNHLYKNIKIKNFIKAKIIRYIDWNQANSNRNFILIRFGGKKRRKINIVFWKIEKK